MFSLGIDAQCSCLSLKIGCIILHSLKLPSELRMMHMGGFTLSDVMSKGHDTMGGSNGHFHS